MATDRQKSYYKFLIPIQSRWMDNDQFGHINNAVYYSLFDTAVNIHLYQHCETSAEGKLVGFVKSSSCQYFKPMTYPNPITVGLAVEKLGNTSVTYRVATFEEKSFGPASSDNEATATGTFVHVYVNKETGKPEPIPEHVRNGLSKLQIKASL
ncbi:hypothetical protein SmJEL517_g05372 [Synchytrium microbalum]|uniref:Uncharacterized protein n=1 Tax=Synchytrium microbalum TaxID=1806994 RepID=A0A507BLQ2_9FUNG|nr:uncharacterized protein SmJEL517_g05372 [Synchytrium microbalum]TPX31260.1 hypothetical protein SmJEL517_g05372 [Synchytrium microbalum]